MSRTVVVADQEQEIYSVRQNGERFLTGHLIRDEYQGDDLYNYSFRPEGAEDSFQVGIMKRDSRVVDPYSVISPLLEAGWEIKTHYYIRRNRKDYQFTLDNPNLPVTEDPIVWDKDLWLGVKSSKITEALIVHGSISPRNSFNIQRGLFRQICTNGMVGEVMQFGKFHVSHSAFDPATMISSIQGFQNAGTDMKRKMGPVFGRPADAGRLASFIRNNFLNPDEADGPGMIAVPNFLRDVVHTFEGLPKWYLERYMTQMNLISQNLDRDVHAIDALNAITNPISLEMRVEEDERNAVGRIVQRQQGILDATEKMIGIFSLN